MSNPTANRGYVLPASTNLVTNLPADFDTFASAVDLDTATKGGYATTATAAGTTTLTLASARNQRFTGTSTQTVVMPVASTLALGHKWKIQNKSTGVVTVQSSGGNTIIAIAAGQSYEITCVLITGTTAASWDYDLDGFTVSPAGSLGTIASGTLSSSSVVLSGIPSTYRALKLTVRNFLPSGDGGDLQMVFNADTGTHYQEVSSGFTSAGTFGAANLLLARSVDNAVAQGLIVVDIPDYANATSWKIAAIKALANNNATTTSASHNSVDGIWNQTSAITSITLSPNSGTFGGTYLLEGVL